jgi:hypothetical protein
MQNCGRGSTNPAALRWERRDELSTVMGPVETAGDRGAEGTANVASRESDELRIMALGSLIVIAALLDGEPVL